ncbi:hypothetical protein SAMN05421743_101377 [Thalassobacillus cyri]|uniref:Uncharacterized protein n=1 Tax=Thalassobacillus cyri TaxID=571932 RepID=A0A1H3WC52_9BACI|nr:hypothetical protein [Thalassobacillus cyri]SDZ83922.1 hypothetical protein SAMN05421743_101377 [Thalassobacillus cyri]
MNKINFAISFISLAFLLFLFKVFMASQLGANVSLRIGKNIVFTMQTFQIAADAITFVLMSIGIILIIINKRQK